MGDAWVRFRAALADNDVIKGASRAMAGLLEKISEFLEKDKDVERAYIIRTKVIKAVQEQESKAPASAAIAPSTFNIKFAFFCVVILSTSNPKSNTSVLGKCRLANSLD